MDSWTERFFGLVSKASLGSWAELLQTYRQSSAGLHYAFHWTRGQSLFGLMSGASPDSWAEFLQTRGRSYFGLMGGASSEAWMNLDFTDVSLSFPSSLQRSSSSSSSFLLFWLEQQRRVFAIQEAGVIRGGAGPSDLLFPGPSTTLGRGFLLRPYQLCRSDGSDVDEGVRIPAGNGARHSWLASQGIPASIGKTNTAWNSSSILMPSAGFRPELMSTGPDRTSPGKKTEEKRGKGVIKTQRIQHLSPDPVLDLPEVT